MITPNTDPDALEKALRPFANEASELAVGIPDDCRLSYDGFPQIGLSDFTVGDLRRAKEALAAEKRRDGEGVRAMIELETLRPEVAAAIRTMCGEAGGNRDDAYDVIEVELLRLADENKRMRGIIETLDVEGHRRAEKAEAELAAVRARIADAPVATLVFTGSGGDLMLIWAENPDEWVDKDVRLLVDEPPAKENNNG